MTAWLGMGGYAAFVWPAYGITAIGLGLLVLVSVRRLRAAERRLAELEGARRRGREDKK